MRRFKILYIIQETTLETREIECDILEFQNELIVFTGMKQHERKGGILIPQRSKIILAFPIKNLVSFEEL